MPKFLINCEGTEDTFNCTNNLQEAIRIAKDVARTVAVGETVSIEHEGKNILLFSNLGDGAVAEQEVRRLSDPNFVLPTYDTTISSNSTAGSPSQ